MIKKSKYLIFLNNQPSHPPSLISHMGKYACNQLCEKLDYYTHVYTYSCNQLLEKLDYYSHGHVLVHEGLTCVWKIKNMIVHMRILFITCILDHMYSCISDCFYEHPQASPFSNLYNKTWVLTWTLCMPWEQWISGFVWRKNIMVTQYQPSPKKTWYPWFHTVSYVF